MQRIVTALLLMSLAFLAEAKPKLAIIIDDLGYEMMPREIASLPMEISVSVIPFTEFDTAVSLAALSQKRQVLLHLPMQSPEGSPQEPNVLTLSMGQSEMHQFIQESLYRVPHAVAVNNHMGSLLTQKPQPMHWVMMHLKERGLGFVDSRTTPKSVALRIAKEHNVPTNRRHVFLDHYNHEAFIEDQLQLAVKLAKKRGIAIAIGHPLPLTLSTLQKALPAIQKEVDLIPITHALKH